MRSRARYLTSSAYFFLHVRFCDRIVVIEIQQKPHVTGEDHVMVFGHKILNELGFFGMFIKIDDVVEKNLLRLSWPSASDIRPVRENRRSLPSSVVLVCMIA